MICLLFKKQIFSSDPAILAI